MLETHLTAPSHCANLYSKLLLHVLPWLLNTRTKLPHAEQNRISRERLLRFKWDMELKNRSQSPNKSSVYQHPIQTWLNTQPVNRTNIYTINCSFKGFKARNLDYFISKNTKNKHRDEQWDRTAHGTELSVHSTQRMLFICILMTHQE